MSRQMDVIPDGRLPPWHRHTSEIRPTPPWPLTSTPGPGGLVPDCRLGHQALKMQREHTLWWLPLGVCAPHLPSPALSPPLHQPLGSFPGVCVWLPNPSTGPTSGRGQGMFIE